MLCVCVRVYVYLVCFCWCSRNVRRCSSYMFFFSSRRRHTRCALVTGVQDVCSSDLGFHGPICPTHRPLAFSTTPNIPKPCTSHAPGCQRKRRQASVRETLPPMKRAASASPCSSAKPSKSSMRGGRSSRRSVSMRQSGGFMPVSGSPGLSFFPLQGRLTPLAFVLVGVSPESSRLKPLLPGQSSRLRRR